MNVRIEAEQLGDGTMRCELTITTPAGTTLRLPARLPALDNLDENVLAALRHGPLALDVETDLIRSVAIERSELVSVTASED